MTDHVFGGMTRPPTVGGVPQIVLAGLLILGIPVILLPLAFGLPFVLSIGGAILVVLLYLTARILCESDHHTFRYLELRMRLMATAPGRKLPGGLVTYSPAPLRKR